MALLATLGLTKSNYYHQLKNYFRSKATEMHLANITPQNLWEWKKDCFISFASSHNGKHNVELGVDGFGKYTIRFRKEKELVKECFGVRKEAIKRYAELISD